MEGLEPLFWEYFARKPLYTLDGYLVPRDGLAKQAETAAVRWAARRNLVVARHTGQAEDAHLFVTDSADSHLSIYTVSERKRLTIYQSKFGNDVVADLNQNPLVIAMRSTNGILHCLIKNAGIIHHSGKDCMLIGADFMTSMGFAVTQAHIDAQCGALNGFSLVESLPAPRQRTFKSQCRQAGNAMHVNSIGAVLFYMILMTEIGKKHFSMWRRGSGQLPRPLRFHMPAIEAVSPEQRDAPIPGRAEQQRHNVTGQCKRPRSASMKSDVGATASSVPALRRGFARIWEDEDLPEEFKQVMVPSTGSSSSSSTQR